MKTRNIVIGSTVGATALLTAGALVYLNKRALAPKGVEVVKDFRLKKYLGKWYEIARLDFRFEKGLNNTMAEYSLNEDGSVKVVNSGYNFRKHREEQSVGKAKFANTPEEGALKVSFFGPLYSGYNIIALDKKYKYALVAGRNLNYLWILSREVTVPEDVKEEYLKIASDLGYKTEELTWVEHNHYIE